MNTIILRMTPGQTFTKKRKKRIIHFYINLFHNYSNVKCEGIENLTLEQGIKMGKKLNHIEYSNFYGKRVKNRVFHLYLVSGSKKILWLKIQNIEII